MSIRENIEIARVNARSLLLKHLSRLIRTFDCEDSTAQFPTLMSLLESLPLSTEEFGLARNRINNARRYADSTEPGAAAYELRLLLGKLQSEQ